MFSFWLDFIQMRNNVSDLENISVIKRHLCTTFLCNFKSNEMDRARFLKEGSLVTLDLSSCKRDNGRKTIILISLFSQFLIWIKYLTKYYLLKVQGDKSYQNLNIQFQLRQELFTLPCAILSLKQHQPFSIFFPACATVSQQSLGISTINPTESSSHNSPNKRSNIHRRHCWIC